MNAIILVKGWTTRTMISLENKHYLTVTTMCIKTKIASIMILGTLANEKRNLVVIHENTLNSMTQVQYTTIG